MSETREVVVGYDGSDFSMQALEWAMDEAELRKLPLTVAHAWRWPYGETGEEARSHLRKAAEHVLYHGADCARSCSSITEVTTDLYEGAAAERLTELSAGAELVVVGSRGMGTLARTVVGSVAGYVAAHARCPVVVVRGPGPIPVPLHRGAVVLGITDDTPDVAIAFAFDEAALRGLDLLAVHAGHIRAVAWGTAMPPVSDVEITTHMVEEDLLRRLRPWRDSHPAVPVRTRFVTASAKEALVELSREASVVVVGGARATGRLGSVTRAVLRHGASPVAVVPVTEDMSQAGSAPPGED
ncbi:universal stress protein [Streptosporangium sp. NPDC000239]|uniref:universal stress protein n=1 Tax=unclassified Streptosporangium TaxID=2632669 RepID=UPI003330D95F